MRLISAAKAKGNKKAFCRQFPKSGTKIRTFYDLLQQHRATPLKISLKEWRLVPPLENIYGLDIRRLGHSEIILVGEWNNDTYVDYLMKGNIIR